jgi:hypothetical protein
MREKNSDSSGGTLAAALFSHSGNVLTVPHTINVVAIGTQGSQSSVRTAVFLGPGIAVRRGAAYEMPRASRARLFFPAPDHKRPQSTAFCVGTQDTLTLGNNRGASGRKIRGTIGPSGETPACKAHGRNIRESIVHSDKTPGTIPRVGVQASGFQQSNLDSATTPGMIEFWHKVTMSAHPPGRELPRRGLEIGSIPAMSCEPERIFSS